MNYAPCPPGLCHGSHCVSCVCCGLVAPCALPDCRSCGESPGVLAEAKARQSRKLGWIADGTCKQVMFASIPLPKKGRAA